MPLIHGLRSTNIWKAFLLNSLAATLVIFIAMTVKGRFDKFTDKNNRQIVRTTNAKSIILTLAATFTASMLAYSLLYFLFGYGYGMLVENKQQV